MVTIYNKQINGRVDGGTDGPYYTLQTDYTIQIDIIYRQTDKHSDYTMLNR